MLYAFSVTPIEDDHFDERVKDIVEMHRNGVIYMPLFCMTLVPEGNPVWDKAGKMCKVYARYRDALLAEGVPSGILVQASLGHGYEITANPFRRYVNLNDGKEIPVCCPDDEGFLAHFEDVMRKLASEKPRAIMLDDDFRLIMRPGLGCACEHHMAEFNRLAGTNMTREELFAYMHQHPKTDRLSRIFHETQRNSLINAAKRFRAAIDEIDPTIQGINCTSGHICESVYYTNKYFKGEGNPTMVRVPNGSYAPIAIREELADAMRDAAICTSKLRKHGIEIILSETDTIPYNRYAKGARFLHAHYASSMLDGLKGAKHWITRMSAFELGSGKAYRDILAKHRGMYERLADLSDEIKFVGCNSAFIEAVDVDFTSPGWGAKTHDNFWATRVMERLGIPFYFSEDAETASFLEGDLVDDMTDEQIETVLRGSVFCDAESAASLIKRGFGDYLGVSVEEWDLGPVSDECFDRDGYITVTKQMELRKLVMNAEGTEALSYNFLRCDGKPQLLAPAVTKFKRADGKLSVVFCGSPYAPFNYMHGFSFLNESRKAQLIQLLCEAGALPIYAEGDDELCMRAGHLSDGTLMAMIIEIGLDPMDELVLKLTKKPNHITMMTPTGEEVPVAFEQKEEDTYELAVRVEPMYPVVLMIR